VSPDHSKIKAHKLAIVNEGEEGNSILNSVPQIKGRGVSVELPTDRGKVVNSVVKPFAGTSEIHRQRATQILDYIISKKKSIQKKVEAQEEQKMEQEEKLLVHILDSAGGEGPEASLNPSRKGSLEMMD
jgi:hypothetical protein